MSKEEDEEAAAVEFVKRRLEQLLGWEVTKEDARKMLNQMLNDLKSKPTGIAHEINLQQLAEMVHIKKKEMEQEEDKQRIIGVVVETGLREEEYKRHGTVVNEKPIEKPVPVPAVLGEKKPEE